VIVSDLRAPNVRKGAAMAGQGEAEDRVAETRDDIKPASTEDTKVGSLSPSR
jgi:hypothetical protein